MILTRKEIEILAALLGKSKQDMAQELRYTPPVFSKKRITRRLSEAVCREYGISDELILKIRELENAVNKR